MAAYKEVDYTKDYIGSSTDTKPASASIGSTCYETDTKKAYIWNGTTWVEV